MEDVTEIHEAPRTLAEASLLHEDGYDISATVKADMVIAVDNSMLVRMFGDKLRVVMFELW